MLAETMWPHAFMVVGIAACVAYVIGKVFGDDYND